jgi:hypothetical protein
MEVPEFVDTNSAEPIDPTNFPAQETRPISECSRHLINWTSGANGGFWPILLKNPEPLLQCHGHSLIDGQRQGGHWDDGTTGGDTGPVVLLV